MSARSSPASSTSGGSAPSAPRHCASAEAPSRRCSANGRASTSTSDSVPSRDFSAQHGGHGRCRICRRARRRRRSTRPARRPRCSSGRPAAMPGAHGKTVLAHRNCDAEFRTERSSPTALHGFEQRLVLLPRRGQPLPSSWRSEHHAAQTSPPRRPQTRLVNASATASRADAAGFRSAPPVSARPSRTLRPRVGVGNPSSVKAATSDTGTCQCGPNICCSCATSPVMLRSPIVIEELSCSPTAGNLQDLHGGTPPRGRHLRSSSGTPRAPRSAAPVHRGACIFGGLPNSTCPRSMRHRRLTQAVRVVHRPTAAASVASPTTAKGQRSRSQMAFRASANRSSGNADHVSALALRCTRFRAATCAGSAFGTVPQLETPAGASIRARAQAARWISPPAPTSWIRQDRDCPRPDRSNGRSPPGSDVPSPRCRAAPMQNRALRWHSHPLAMLDAAPPPRPINIAGPRRARSSLRAGRASRAASHMRSRRTVADPASDHDRLVVTPAP